MKQYEDTFAYSFKELGNTTKELIVNLAESLKKYITTITKNNPPY